MTNDRDKVIDFMKFVGFLLVFFVHSVQFIQNLWFPFKAFCLFGQTGVQLFLLCSGILVYRKISKVKDYLSVKNVYNGYVKFFPLYFFFSIVYLVLNISFREFNITVPFQNTKDILGYLLNVFLLHGFSSSYYNNVVPGGWYIGAIFVIYLFVPGLVWISNKIACVHRYLFISVCLTIFNVIVNVYMSKFVNMGNGSYFIYSFINQMPAFLVGMYVEDRIEKEYSSKGMFIGFIVLIFLCYLLFFFYKNWCYSVIPLFSAFAFALLYKILLSITKKSWLKMSSKIFLFAIKIGKDSYAAYLLSFLFSWYLPCFVLNCLHISNILFFMLCFCLMLYALPPMASLLSKINSTIYIKFKNS